MIVAQSRVQEAYPNLHVCCGASGRVQIEGLSFDPRSLLVSPRAKTDVPHESCIQDGFHLISHLARPPSLILRGDTYRSGELNRYLQQVVLFERLYLDLCVREAFGLFQDVPHPLCLTHFTSRSSAPWVTTRSIVSSSGRWYAIFKASKLDHPPAWATSTSGKSFLELAHSRR